jgi:hypothetical protein
MTSTTTSTGTVHGRCTGIATDATHDGGKA